MTGSHEVRGSSPLSSTNEFKGLRIFSASPFLLAWEDGSAIAPLLPATANCKDAEKRGQDKILWTRVPSLGAPLDTLRWDDTRFIFLILNR
jgi:hypothetical protein